MPAKVGLWIIGAYGGVATTFAVGLAALTRRLAKPIGVVSDAPEFANLQLVRYEDLVLGGCDLRRTTLEQSAREIEQANHSLPTTLIDSVATELAAIDRNITPGFSRNAGSAVQQWVTDPTPNESLRDVVRRIRESISRFCSANGLDRVIVINLASTEPVLRSDPSHANLVSLDAALDDNRLEVVCSSLLYSYAAIAEGCGFVNFTPANGAVIPALIEFAERNRVPLCGSDGKTGETLIKSILAPMFRARQLRVLSWQGYNILGDRDGEVLSDKTHLEAKVKSKDRALASILGYSLHTHVGIDYVPSLHDLKTAWDFIHFEGFLGHRMSMQFIWQGCDSILAAPLILDLARLTELAMRHGQGGIQRHLASFFKSPLGCDEHDFREQWNWLIDYAASMARATATGSLDSKPDI